ncbi:hypothetical protein [Paenibacillus xylanexedens]|uniref:hypothetical protein n=1 Tax=Paenibacillus xylanexedens TaxID=528191 RepID=UPI000F530B8F|nr:hypothetical protein [Paenibacillus xylanexedens]RPK20099.1 hypothetical protein EDO6_06638 [Paenibacillus xylanexedens]
MSKNVGSYHMKAFKFIKNLIAKYGQAFPSIPTLAKVAGCTERYMTTIVNDLAEWGYLKKVPRYNLSRQLSNGYEIIAEMKEEVIHKEPEVKAEPKPTEVVETVHPIKDSLKASLQAPIQETPKTAFTKPFIKTEEDDTPPTGTRTRVQSEYQMWFLRDAVEQLGVDTARAIFPYAKPMIDTTKPMAWHNAIKQFKAVIHQAKALGPYFQTVFTNEILKHQVSVIKLRETKKTAFQPSW